MTISDELYLYSIAQCVGLHSIMITLHGLGMLVLGYCIMNGT